ncbi:MAG: ABC transporter ATP-binding protein [bacterium]|nr:ABC transporter ATP-binding protein [bacterium]
MTSLIAQNVTLRRGRRTVLGGADFELRPGELVLLAGRNGAGKSTLLRLLVGAIRPDDGLVALDQRPLAVWDPLERARELAFVEQNAETPFEFTGRELVAMGRYPHRPRAKTPHPDDLVAIENALTAVDAMAFCDRPVTTLSGGEQRRITIARALATQAPLLLLDEPTANLDLEHALQLVELLRQLADRGHGITLASHDLNLLAPHCDRVALLHEGRIIASGPPQQTLSTARIREVFGVRATDPDGYFPRRFER